ncbi:hypothetical protein IDM40_06180 [Nocardiopsis sp. HNM0947]|uniref:Uncharacterized protein n=1 Tax=Nocardiopsis coralli TaxID=2772213 RepID=A0ABR9P3A6_9ACTN|nr:DUF5682 family protein [Nocardiopsis coralli]MBE2998294.1 hypothetical protein [Nocardiopsis coralli]
MPTVDMEGVRVLGVRHHGPGSARAVRAELERLRPEAVLIEGPPEADALVHLVGELEPPVALLAHRTGRGTESGGEQGWAFWPFASFSPEWVALRYAVEHGAEVRFCDLPAAHTLAPEPEPEPEPDGDSAAPADPLGTLARAAGYDDTERWWDDVVEQRGDGEPSPFPAIQEAMAAVRDEAGSGGPRTERREAHMRQVLRATLRTGHHRVAVVCGAWHAPALHGTARHTVKDDTALLKGLPRAKVAATWVPWTHGRLASAAGYRAGVSAPGWYHHLFSAPDRPVHRWLTDAARTLREDEGQAVSSAHVIEGVRLAETLAALRGRPLAGLDEVREALTGVLCEGHEARAALVHGRLALGERMGSVPPSTPMVPLQHDLAAQRRRLRLKAEPFTRDLDLDLRKDLHRERGVLLHRLRVLDVEWGVPRTPEGGHRGTFREAWRLRWEPEMDVALIEAARWGATVEEAAAARVTELADDADLRVLTALTEQCLLAALDTALPAVLARLTDRAATDADVTALMAALPPLARAGRYGDVRRTEGAHLRSVADGLLRRVCAGLAPALRGLDDDAAAHAAALLDRTHQAVTLLGAEPLRSWTGTLSALAGDDRLPGRVAGRVDRILSDAGELDPATLRRRLARTMSPGTEPARAAAWLEGFLQGSGLVLVHDERLLDLIDTWLTGLSPERFADVLPLLRRTFGAFAAPERRRIGAAATRTRSTAEPERPPPDPARAEPAVAAVGAILAHAAAERPHGRVTA